MIKQLNVLMFILITMSAILALLSEIMRNFLLEKTKRRGRKELRRDTRMTSMTAT